MVEAVHELACELYHRLLVLTGRHRSGLEEGDVSSLRDRIAEEAEGHGVVLKTTHLHLRLHGGVALHTCHRDDIHQIGRQLGELRDTALDIECALGRVETYREIVEGHIDDTLANLLGVIGIVGQGLDIGHEDKHAVVVTFVLKLYAAAQTSHIVSKMQAPCGPVACEDYFSHCISFILDSHY